MVKKLLISLLLFVIIGTASAGEPNISLKVFMADWCPYCTTLDNEYLKPIEKRGDYKNKLKIITQYDIDTSDEILKYYIRIVPLMIFVDAKTGEELYRITGLPGEDFFWEVFDDGIKEANKEWQLKRKENQ